MANCLNSFDVSLLAGTSVHVNVNGSLSAWTRVVIPTGISAWPSVVCPVCE